MARKTGEEQAIEQLGQEKEQQKRFAIERAVEMLRIASGVLKDNEDFIDTTVIYDGTECDVSCIAEDCIDASNVLVRYLNL